MIVGISRSGGLESYRRRPLARTDTVALVVEALPKILAGIDVEFSDGLFKGDWL